MSATTRLEVTVPKQGQHMPFTNTSSDALPSVEQTISSLPNVDMWPDMSFEERERRAAVLEDIKRRVRENEPHIARSNAERARQFMPFSALKGYDSLTEAVEREINE